MADPVRSQIYHRTHGIPDLNRHGLRRDERLSSVAARPSLSRQVSLTTVMSIRSALAIGGTVCLASCLFLPWGQRAIQAAASPIAAASPVGPDQKVTPPMLTPGPAA